MTNSVCFAIPAYDGKLPVEAAVQLAHTAMCLKSAGWQVDMQWGAESALIDLCRNRLVKRFLNETTAQKLFFLDSDIIFQAADALKLLGWSEAYPIVGAAYPVRKDPPKFFIKLDPGVVELNEHGLLEVSGFGAGFVVIDRSVFEKMKPLVAEIETNTEPLTQYFDIRVLNGKYLGEDISFYVRWKEECGGRIFIDPNINLKHVGSKTYEYKLLDYLNNVLERVD